MIKKIINKILNNLGKYEIRKIIPKEFSDLKYRDLETAMKILCLMKSNIDKKIFNKYKEFFEYCQREKDFSFSQSFQDLFVCWKLKHKKGGIFVEFGADDGILNSNSLLLEKKYNWNGILVEPNPSIQKTLSKNRNCNIENYIISNKSNNINKFESKRDRQQSEVYIGGGITPHSEIFKIKTITLNNLLEKNNIKAGFDFLSIDVEGNELAVLEGFDIDYWRPKIVVIEHNFNIDNMNLISKFFLEKGYAKELELFSFHDFWFVLD